MAAKIVPYKAAHVPLVRDFNARMAAAGSNWKFYESHMPDWIARDPGRLQSVWREYFVAIEEDVAVHGAYVLKPQKFVLRGSDTWLASWQGPISEGLINPRHGLLAIRFMAHMQRQQPKLIAWGASERLSTLIKKLGWRIIWMPFFVQVLEPRRFLRQANYLRASRRNQLLFDGLASSGLGTLAFRVLQTSWHRVGVTKAEVVPRFGEWAEEIWTAAREHYTLIACRDMATLNELMAGPGWPNATIIRVASENRTIGWAACRTTRMRGDRRFGDMHVGSVIDALSYPGYERSVIDAVTRFLQDQEVDLIATNFSHPVWGVAFRRAGYIRLRYRRLFAMSPELEKAAAPVDDQFCAGLHLTPIDGDGPRGL